MSRKVETFQCKSKRIISIGEDESSSKLFLTIDFVLNDTNVNLNGVQYSESFLQDIVDNQDEYISMPLKVDYNKLINENVSSLTHNYSKSTNRFYNQMIGSFTKFYIEKSDNGEYELCGQVRIPKEFDQACEIIQQLYEDNSLFVSYEIYVGKYTTKNNGEIKYVDKDPENYLSAYSIVSTPAVPSAKAIALVAELIDKEGEEIVPSKTKYTKQQFIADFKKGIKKKEIAELSYDQVMSQLWDQIKINLGDEYYDFYMEDNGVDFMIMQNYSDGSLIRIDFTVDGDTVVALDAYPVIRSYEPANKNEDGNEEDNNNEEDDDNMTLEEAKAKIEAAEAKLKAKETELASKIKEVSEKDKKVKAKDDEIAEANKKVETLSASVLEKDNVIKDLKPIEEKYNTLIAEKTEKENAAKRVELKNKFSKLLSAEILSEPEMAEAINELDESKLNSRVVEIAMAKATEETKDKKVETASIITDNLNLEGEKDLVSKYITRTM